MKISLCPIVSILSFMFKPLMAKSLPTESIYDIEVTDIDDNKYLLEEYRGKVLLIVNVASNCRLADKSYKELAALLEKYNSNGLVILLFPCNQYKNQEYGTKPEIKNFVAQYGDQFILMDVVQVKGPEIHPLFKYLTNKLTGFFTNDIKWNFTYFLIGRNGESVKRYSPLDGISVTDRDLVNQIFPPSSKRSVNSA